MLKATVCALGIALIASTASALTFTEGPDLSNVINNTVNPPATNLGTLAQGINTIQGSLGGDCIQQVPGSVTNCQNGIDPQDAFVVEVPTGTQLDAIDIITSSVGGPPGFTFRFDILEMQPLGGGNFQLNNTSVFVANVVPNGTTFVAGLPLQAGQYVFSMFAFGATANNVVGSYDGLWEVNAIVESNPLPAVPLPSPAILMLSVVGAGLVARHAKRI